VAARHLVPFGNFPLLGDVHPDQLVDAGGQFVPVFPGEHLHVDDNAAGAVGNAEGGIPYLPRLFTENGVEEPLFGGQLGHPFGGHFADEDVARLDFGTDADNSPFVQVPEGVLPDVGDVPGDFLGTQLGVPGFAFVFLDVDRGVDVLLHQLFAKKNGVLIVVSFPGHEGDEDVLTQGQFPQFGGGAVGDGVPLLHPVAHLDDAPLVDAGALVGAGKLDQFVFVQVALDDPAVHFLL